MLKDALADCASTLSHGGEDPALSTYSIDRMLARLEGGAEEIGHGNLWVLTRSGSRIEVRMDIDDPLSEPLDTVDAATLTRQLQALRCEVIARLADGHTLANQHWSQQNPG